MAEINVVIYTKDWCGYCRAAKQLLDQLKVPYSEVDVTHDTGLFEEMVERAEGRTTVPQIFINNRGIGGYTELYRLVEQNTAQQGQ